jgi:hypothetical protein
MSEPPVFNSLIVNHNLIVIDDPTVAINWQNPRRELFQASINYYRLAKARHFVRVLSHFIPMLYTNR